MRFITIALWATLAAGMLFTRASCTLDDDAERLRAIIDELVERYPLLNRRSSAGPSGPQLATVLHPQSKIFREVNVLLLCKYGDFKPQHFEIEEISDFDTFQLFIQLPKPDAGTEGLEGLRAAMQKCRDVNGRAAIKFWVLGERYKVNDQFIDAKLHSYSLIEIETEPRIGIWVDFWCPGLDVDRFLLPPINPEATLMTIKNLIKPRVETCKNGPDDEVTYEFRGETIKTRKRLCDRQIGHGATVSVKVTRRETR